MRPIRPVAVATLSLGLVLGGCSAGSSEVVAPTPTPTGAPTEAAAEAPAEEPAPEPAPVEAAKGARENPARPDVDAITFSEAGAPVYEVMLSTADPAGNDVVAGYYELNPPPGDGHTYVLLPVSATYLGAGTGEAWLDLDITFVAADGRTFESSDALVPGDLMLTSDLSTGEVAQGILPFALPDGALASGVWSVVHESGTDMTPAFYAAL
jgi:hypothetical protein